MGDYRVADTEKGRVLIVGEQRDGGWGGMDCRGDAKRFGWKQWGGGEGHRGLRFR